MLSKLDNLVRTQAASRFKLIWVIPQLLAAAYFIDRLGAKKPWQTKWAEREAAGLAPRLADYMDTGFWWASLFGLCAVILLLVTTRYWIRPSSSPMVTIAVRRGSYWTVLGLILVAALLMRLPRMNHSFWGDEEWAVRSYAVGTFKKDESGAIQFKPAAWKDTFFYNSMANNHILQTVLSRASLQTWQRLTGREKWEFEESIARLPVLVGGLLSLVLVAVMLARWGWPDAGLTASLLLAVHPWHIRYSTEARGYSLAQCGLLGLIICAVEATRDCRWRWPVGGALCSAAAVLAWPGALPNVALMQAIFLGLLAYWASKQRLEWANFWRWFAAHTAVAPWVALLLFPHLPQIQRQIRTSGMFQGELGIGWFQDAGALIVSGMLWKNKEPGNPFAMSLQTEWTAAPMFWITMAGLVLFVLLAGVVALSHKTPTAGVLLKLAAMTGSVAVLICAVLDNRLLYHWYLTPLLPLLAVLFCSGSLYITTKIAGAVTKNRQLSESMGCAFLLILIGLFVYSERAFLRSQNDHAVEDLRAAAAVTRGLGDWRAPGNRETVILCRRALLYDPNAHSKNEDTEFAQLIRTCTEEGKAFHVVVGMRPYAFIRFPKTMALLENPLIFEPGVELWALERRYTLHTYRLRKDWDMSALDHIMAQP